MWACSAYVDLNPIRAGMVEDLAASGGGFVMAAFAQACVPAQSELSTLRLSAVLGYLLDNLRHAADGVRGTRHHPNDGDDACANLIACVCFTDELVL